MMKKTRRTLDLDHDDDTEDADDPRWRAETLVFWESSVPDFDVDHPLGAVPGRSHNHHRVLRPLQYPLHWNFLTIHASSKKVSGSLCPTNGFHWKRLYLLCSSCSMVFSTLLRALQPELCLCHLQSFQHLSVLWQDPCPLDNAVKATLKHLTNWSELQSAILSRKQIRLYRCCCFGSIAYHAIVLRYRNATFTFSPTFTSDLPGVQRCCQVPKEPVSPTRLSPNVCPPWKAGRQGPPSRSQRGLPLSFREIMQSSKRNAVRKQEKYCKRRALHPKQPLTSFICLSFTLFPHEIANPIIKQQRPR